MATLASQAFAALVRARERAYARGILGSARLPAPVWSVGNLSVGGSGKTPCVIAIGRALAARGVAFDVLTRGYRRHGRQLAVAHTGDEDVALTGDEPKLLAQRLQAPVLVHPDRFRAGMEGERRFGSRLHLLDDGFQHRQLARCFDLVLVTPADLEDRMLPAGRLREPPAALSRASAVVWVAEEEEAGAAPGYARERLARFTSAPVFLARKRVHAPAPPPQRPFAFCGLARPESFWNSLRQLGVEPAGRRAFRDHHFYRASDLRALERAARAAGAASFMTTAKDAVKLPPAWGPCTVVELEMEIPGLDTLMALAWEACGL